MRSSPLAATVPPRLTSSWPRLSMRRLPCDAPIVPPWLSRPAARRLTSPRRAAGRRCCRGGRSGRGATRRRPLCTSSPPTLESSRACSWSSAADSFAASVRRVPVVLAMRRWSATSSARLASSSPPCAVRLSSRAPPRLSDKSSVVALKLASAAAKCWPCMPIASVALTCSRPLPPRRPSASRPAASSEPAVASMRLLAPLAAIVV